MLDKLATKSSTNTKRGASSNLLNQGLQKPLKALANLKKSAGGSNLSNLEGTTVAGTANAGTNMKQYRNTHQALGQIHSVSQEEDR